MATKTELEEQALRELTEALTDLIAGRTFDISKIRAAYFKAKTVLDIFENLDNPY